MTNGTLEELLYEPLISTFESALVQAPRSQQKLIGPSELGVPCDRCLAKKLGGMQERGEPAWYPGIGTAVHNWAEEVVMKIISAGNAHRFADALPEKRVPVGIIGNRLIEGTADLFDVVSGTVVDYKVQGANTQKKLKASGPGAPYRPQVHLYGRGYELLGYDVFNVSILSIPRSEPTLRHSHFWHEPYDRQVALDTLERAERMYQIVQLGGEAAIKALDRAPGCYSCPKLPWLDGEDPPYDMTGFAGIL